MNLLKIVIVNLCFLTLLGVFKSSISQASTQGLLNCESKKDCLKCIRTPGCSWCKNHDFEEPGHPYKGWSRCNTIENHSENPFCKNESLEIPQSFVNVRKNLSLSAREVHISPQKAQVQLSVGVPVTLDLEYLEAKDKPLDLYYILDLSHTMKDDKETVANQSQRLATELGNVTSEVKLGFGSFIDKPVLPFVSYIQVAGTSEFDIPWGFKNHLSLTSNISEFRRIVEESKLSGNVDSPEGGLEALVQAIVCTKEIGWRNDSRKLIVMATDGGFHIAGDGKLGGIVVPNDLKCHLNEKNEYTHATLHDYPSVAALNHIVKKNKVYLIFAVTQSELPVYELLSRHVLSSKAALLEANSNNVVELVKDQYKTLSSRVSLERLGYENFIDVAYEVKCKPDEPWNKTNECHKIGPSDVVKYRVTLTLRKCPKLADRNKTLLFTTFELREAYEINIDFACECNCAKKEQAITDKKTLDKYCFGHADKLQCGKCICDEDHTGVNCACKKLGEDDTTGNNKTNCISNGIECSLRGKCECSTCQCTKGFSGKYCECEDSRCKLNGNSSEPDCSGKGKCICGKCKCDEGVAGPNCQCPNENITCKEPGSWKICNGQGKCSCTQSDDTRGGNWTWHCDQNCGLGYSGKYCHICRGCSSSNSSLHEGSRCSEPDLIECVKCHLKKQQGNSQSDKIDCSEFCIRKFPADGDIDSYDVTVSSMSDVESNAIRCSPLQYNETCSTGYSYSYQEGKLRLTLQLNVDNNLICRAPTQYFWYIVGVVGGVLFVGILTLIIWKIFTDFHDSREYERFEKERDAARWDTDENPLYSTPMQTFQNPTYRK